MHDFARMRLFQNGSVLGGFLRFGLAPTGLSRLHLSQDRFVSEDWCVLGLVFRGLGFF